MTLLWVALLNGFFKSALNLWTNRVDVFTLWYMKNFVIYFNLLLFIFLSAFADSPGEQNPAALEQKTLTFPSSEAPLNELFLTGIKLFQEKNYQKATESFWQAYQLAPSDPAVLWNLALSSQLRQTQTPYPGLSIAAVRKLIKLQPFNFEAQDLFDSLSQKFDSFSEHSFMMTANANFFRYFHLNILIIFFLAFLFIFLWKAAPLWAERKSAKEENTDFSLRQHLSLLLPIGILIIIFAFACVGKFALSYDKKATLLSELQMLHTGPGENFSKFVEVRAGQEFSVKKWQENWVFVELNNEGSGWLPKDVIFLTSEKPW